MNTEKHITFFKRLLDGAENSNHAAEAAIETAYNALHNKSRGLRFGDYVSIEQKRYGAPNQFFTYKVVGSDGQSNYYRSVPVDARQQEEISGDGLQPVVRVICCGVIEDRVETFRVADVIRSTEDWNDIPMTKGEDQ